MQYLSLLMSTDKEPTKIGLILVYVLLGIFLPAGILYLMRHTFYKEGYPQLMPFIFGSILIFIILLALYKLITFPKQWKKAQEPLDDRPKKTGRGLVIFIRVFMLAVILGFNYLVISQHNSFSPVAKEEVKQLQGTLLEKPYYFDPHRGSASFYMTLAEFPKLRFNIPFASSMEAASLAFYAGDTVIFELHQEDYDLWIDGLREPGFWDYTMGYGNIVVLSLADPQKTYLSLETYNSWQDDDSETGLWIAGVLNLIYIIYWLVKLAKPQDRQKPIE